ncbi:MAG TPA: DUF697 domain-containing protein [Bacteroidetes bacterium]|nr:DUF697 domain-containing protein [Bacteroidota bacterium]
MNDFNKLKEGRDKHAETIIRNHILFSMGAGVIPVPIVDIFAVSAAQLDMIRQLCKVYDVDFAETQGKAIVSSLTTATLARIGAGSLAKMIPVIGSIIGGVTNAAMAGASTYALGQVFKIHFETGGTILDFDVSRLKKLYKEQFEKGKKVAEEMRQQQKAKRDAAEKAAEEAKAAETIDEVMEETVDLNKTDTDETIARLKQLGELKEAGVITDFEFERMKKRVLKS